MGFFFDEDEDEDEGERDNFIGFIFFSIFVSIIIYFLS